jgi:ribosomal protein S18 acetylase RimI-like enzyme
MAALQFVRATPQDVIELKLMSVQTFLDAYADSNSASNMARYIEESFAEKQLEAELRNKDSEFYLAKTDSVIGYIKLNFGAAQTERQDEQAMEIERIYVLQAYYGKGIGGQLMEFAIARAQARKLHRIWLGVWEHNPRALRFYTKHGFTAFGKHIFKLGDEEQWDVMMELSLRP